MNVFIARKCRWDARAVLGLDPSVLNTKKAFQLRRFSLNFLFSCTGNAHFEPYPSSTARQTLERGSPAPRFALSDTLCNPHVSSCSGLEFPASTSWFGSSEFDLNAVKFSLLNTMCLRREVHPRVGVLRFMQVLRNIFNNNLVMYYILLGFYF